MAAAVAAAVVLLVAAGSVLLASLPQYSTRASCGALLFTAAERVFVVCLLILAKCSVKNTRSYREKRVGTLLSSCLTLSSIAS